MLFSNLKIVVFIIFFSILVSNCLAQEKTDSKEFNLENSPIEKEVKNQYLKLSLNGNIKPMQEILSKNGDKSPKLKKLNEEFTKRFVTRTEKYESSGDKFVDETLAIFRNYWIEVLMQKTDASKAETELDSNLAELVSKYGLDQKQNPAQTVRDEFTKRGFYLLTGVTAPYRELMIWKRQDEKIYDVKLTDTKQNLTVVALYDFVSHGWLSFSSFGINASAGWATRDKLFVVASAYEIGSESFEVSYLKHEARHFVDRRNFPDLQGFELEYRAKLTELVYAEETSLKLINKFIVESNKDSKAAHPLGNHKVISDMSKAIFKKNYEGDLEEWEKLKTPVIQRTARKLLQQKTKKLYQLK